MNSLALNLPLFEPTLKSLPNGLHIKDIIRKKFIKLTPEEWVRQHFLNYLVNHLHYPKTLVRSELGLKYSGQYKRADIVVFDKQGEPYIIIECKSFEITLNKNTLLQASTYQSKLKAKFVGMTNGIEHIYLSVETNQPQEISLLPACNF